MTTQWHKDMTAAIQGAYDRMRAAGMAKGMNLHIYASVSSYGNEELTIKYSIGDYGDTDKTEGSDLLKMVTEYMRRKNWTEANKPMLLIGSEVLENEDAS